MADRSTRRAHGRRDYEGSRHATLLVTRTDSALDLGAALDSAIDSALLAETNAVAAAPVSAATERDEAPGVAGLAAEAATAERERSALPRRLEPVRWLPCDESSWLRGLAARLPCASMCCHAMRARGSVASQHAERLPCASMRHPPCASRAFLVLPAPSMGFVWELLMERRL